MIDPTYQFRELLLNDQHLLEKLVEPVQLSDGQFLFCKGDPGDAFYLIESGKLRIFTLDEDGKEITLNTMVCGETLGELALLDIQPRSASAVAVGSCSLRRINRIDFLDQVYTSPALSACMIQILSGRIRHMTEYVEQMGLWSRMMIDGKYNEVIQDIEQLKIDSNRALAAAANTIRQMVEVVQQREDTLRQQVVQLRIEIDQEKRQKQVKEITNLEDFQQLLELAKQRRKQIQE